MRERSREPCWIALAALLVLAVDLGGRVLTNNDEARFPLLAQDILARGDWLHPRINGALYANTPVLLAWFIALASWPAGQVTQLTAALPSAAAGVATVLLVYGVGRDFLGAEAGRFAALVAMTMQGLFLHARLPLPDMLMTCFITASLWALAKVVRGDRGPYWVGFYGLTGLAFWAKGPAGLLPLAAALVHRIVTRRSERRPALHAAPGLALVAGLVGLWWISGALVDGAAVRQAVVVDQLAWYRPHPPTLATLTAPVRNVFGILFPWVLVVPVVVACAARFVRGRGAERDRVLFLLVWAGVTVTLVALSHQQRLRYYLPLVPSLALLIGWWAAGVEVRGRRIDRVPWRLYVAGAAVVAAATSAFLVSRGGFPRDAAVETPSALEGVVALAGLATMVTALWRGARAGRLRRAFVVASVGSALVLATTSHGELHRRNASYDYPRVAASVKPLLEDARLVAAWGVPALPLSFYLGQPVVPVESDAGLQAAGVGDRPAIVVFRDTALVHLGPGGRGAMLGRDRLGADSISLVRYDARWR